MIYYIEWSGLVSKLCYFLRISIEFKKGVVLEYSSLNHSRDDVDEIS